MEVFEGLSDDDEYFYNFVEYQRRPQIVRQRFNPFEEYDDKDFFIRFRLSKATVLYILELIEGALEHPTDR